MPGPAPPDALGEPEPPHCPICGYERRGIDGAARCPECGGDGLEGVLVVEGRDRFSRVLILIAFASYAAVAIGVTGSMVWRQLSLAASVGGSIDGAMVAFTGLVSLPAIVLGVALWKKDLHRRSGSLLESPRVAWIVHPAGIEIVEGGRRRWIPRESIRSVHRIDSFLFPVSQLHLRFNGRRRILGSTPVLHLRGERAHRADIVGRMRSILELAPGHR